MTKLYFIACRYYTLWLIIPLIQIDKNLDAGRHMKCRGNNGFFFKMILALIIRVCEGCIVENSQRIGLYCNYEGGVDEAHTHYCIFVIYQPAFNTDNCIGRGSATCGYWNNCLDADIYRFGAADGPGLGYVLWRIGAD
jgi:hypothetical protein